MILFDTLEKKQKFTFFNSGPENRYFLATSGVLSTVGAYKTFARAQKPFDILRANILCRAIINKRTLDDIFVTISRQYKKNGELRHEGEIAIKKAAADARKDMPRLELGGETIYVPILPKSLNSIYEKDLLKLTEKPFKAMLGPDVEALLIDPFDAYGWKLFDSYFTNLILVRQNAKTAAMFDYDSLSIYFINSQGRLDAKISLFDRYIGKRTTNHMLERITPAVDAYFRDDYPGLVQTLVQNQLISSRIAYKVSSDEKRIYAKLEKQFDND